MIDDENNMKIDDIENFKQTTSENISIDKHQISIEIGKIPTIQKQNVPSSQENDIELFIPDIVDVEPDSDEEN